MSPTRETIREQGRLRSARYYARIKELTGETHPERKQRVGDPGKREYNCKHKCQCTELTTSIVCGFCKIGLCE